MSDFPLFTFGFLLGGLLMIVTCGVITNGDLKERRLALEACEAELPRNQSCKLIGVVKEEL